MDDTGQSPIFYEIDFEKVNTIEDIKDLFKALNIVFPSGHKKFDQIKHLLKRVQ